MRATFKYCEECFGVGYPFQKLDIVFLPDFPAVGIENVGAITLAEELLS